MEKKLRRFVSLRLISFAWRVTLFAIGLVPELLELPDAIPVLASIYDGADMVGTSDGAIKLVKKPVDKLIKKAKKQKQFDEALIEKCWANRAW